MLYDSYRSKIQKVVDFMRKIFAHMVLIVVVFSAVMLLVAAFLATKGIILDVGECKGEIYYGQSTGFEATALFSSVRYEYSEQGTDKWSEAVPKYPGKYSVRAVSNGSFGSKKYTKVQNFTILPLDIELKATESSVQYGVSPTPNSVVLKNGDRIANLDFEFDNKTVGSRKVKIKADTLVIKNVGGKDVTKCYNISTPETDIEITKRVVNITTGSLETEYNGKTVSCTDYEITGGDSIADGETLEVVSFPTVEGVTSLNYDVIIDDDVYYGDAAEIFPVLGPVVNEIKFCIYDSNGIDVTENYELVLTFGEIKVKQKQIVFHTNSAVWTYDATVHSDKEYTVKDLIGGHRLEATGFPELVYPTTSSVHNTADVKIFDENGKDVTWCYHILYDTGMLTLNKRPLVIKTGDATWIYDGKPHYCDQYEIITDDGKGLPLVDGHKLVVEEHRTVTDVVSAANRPIRAHIYTDGEEDLYNYYDVSYECGTISVTKRPIILRTGSGSWMYDGTEYSVPVFEILPGSDELDTALAEGEIFEIQAFRTIKNAGTVENDPLSYTISDAKKKTTSNYEIIPEFGTLTVTPRPILVQTGSMTWVYDGEEHSYPMAFAVSDPYDEYEDILPEHKIQVRESPKLTDVGAVKNTFTIFGILENGVNIKDNYDISYTYGTIEVTKRSVTVLTGSLEETYDGQPHSTTDYGVIPYYYDFVDGHRLEVSASSSITNVGYTDNVFDKYDVVNQNGVSVFGNYDISFEHGTLTIIPRPIAVMSASDDKRYDGTPLANPSCYVSEDSPYELVFGHVISASVTGTRTEIGISPNTIDRKSVKIFENGVDISYNYEVISCKAGTLEVLPAAHITVTTDSASKVYDGTPLTSPTYKHNIDGKLLDGHFLNVVVEGSIVDVGIAENNGYAWVSDAYGNDVTRQYYTIDVKFGTLEIKETEDQPDIGVIYAKICTGKTGYVYLRMNSYGDLVDQTWLDAKEYDKTLPGGYSYNYLTSFALKNYGTETDYMLLVTESEVYFLPYYPSMNGKYEVPYSDTKYSSGLNEYELEYFMLPNDFDFEKLKGNLGEYSADEKEYREFVYENYLNIDAATMNLMLKMIDKNELDASDPDIIRKVAECIKISATYKLDYDERLDKESNMVVSFLNRYKEGKCTHFAASATMLFRALGIPARYVEGFALATKAGEFVDVKSPGHAWVEVYLDGIGWIPVEVTPGFGGSGGVPGDGEGKPTIEVIPKFVYKDYDGSYLYAENEVEYSESIRWLVENGYTYTVEVKGEQLNPGSSDSVVVSFEIYDKDGNRVTSEFDVQTQNGVVRVHGQSIKLYLYQIQKYYDGTPLEYEDGDYEIIEMPDDYTLELDINISLTDCGYLTLDEINRNIDSYISYRVYDKNGVNITDGVSIVFDVFDDHDNTYIPIKVDECKIELTTASEKKEYDDEIVLENEEVYISKGSLIKGHTLYAKAIGIITDVGMVYNEIDLRSVYILDADGNDVTGNYEIAVVLGILEITPADTED